MYLFVHKPPYPSFCSFQSINVSVNLSTFSTNLSMNLFCLSLSVHLSIQLFPRINLCILSQSTHIVSNYTQTLDLIERMCNQENWHVLRLDGTVSATKRTKLVDEFNHLHNQSFVFLLSSKAGGCGINLIGKYG